MSVRGQPHKQVRLTNQQLSLIRSCIPPHGLIHIFPRILSDTPHHPLPSCHQVHAQRADLISNKYILARTLIFRLRSHKFNFFFFFFCESPSRALQYSKIQTKMEPTASTNVSTELQDVQAPNGAPQKLKRICVDVASVSVWGSRLCLGASQWMTYRPDNSAFVHSLRWLIDADG